MPSRWDQHSGQSQDGEGSKEMRTQGQRLDLWFQQVSAWCCHWDMGKTEKEASLGKQKLNHKITGSFPGLPVAGSLLTFGPQMSAKMSPPQRDCHNLFLIGFIPPLHQSLSYFPIIFIWALICYQLTTNALSLSSQNYKLSSQSNLIPLFPLQAHLPGTSMDFNMC